MRPFMYFYAFIFFFLALIFKEGDRIQTLVVQVVQDHVPELLEDYLFALTSARLINKTMDFTQRPGNFPVNIPPLIDPIKSSMNLTVPENDFPYGIVGFEKQNVIYHEWEGVVRVPVVRRG